MLLITTLYQVILISEGNANSKFTKITYIYEFLGLNLSPSKIYLVQTNFRIEYVI